MTTGNSDDDAPVVVKKPSARKRFVTKDGSRQSNALAPDAHQPSYDPEHLWELRQSTPTTPKGLTIPCRSSSIENAIVDIEAGVGQLAKICSQVRIPTEAEIREKKERRARLGNKNEYISLDPDVEDDLTPHSKLALPLVSDNEEFTEDLESFVEDGALSLGKVSKQKELWKRRSEIKDFIDQAELNLEENESDHDRGVLYEELQIRAGMEGVRVNGRLYSQSAAPLRLTPIPKLDSALCRLRNSLVSLDQSKQQLIHRLEELQNERSEISQREEEIKTLLRDAGDSYQRLRQEIWPGVTTQDRSSPTISREASAS